MPMRVSPGTRTNSSLTPRSENRFSNIRAFSRPRNPLTVTGRSNLRNSPAMFTPLPAASDRYSATRLTAPAAKPGTVQARSMAGFMVTVTIRVLSFCMAASPRAV